MNRAAREQVGAFLSVLMIVAVPARAQSVRALVSHGETTNPVSRAWVVLLRNGVPIDSAMTNAIGLVSLQSAPGEGFSIQVYRTGYQAVRSEAFSLDLNTNPFLQITLFPNVTELEPIQVRGEAPDRVRSLENAGFYNRRDEGNGSFIEREEIERLTPQKVTDLLRHMPGATVVNNPGYGRGRPGGQRDTRRVKVLVARSMASLHRSTCPPLFFVDGVLLGSDEEIVVDEALSITNVMAVEIFRGVQVPAQYNLTGSSCGVVLFWTR